MSDDLHQTSSGKRLDVISWDEFFMSVAIAAQRRSKDPNTQVGACIASTNHRILSVGYNGTPSALNDDFSRGVRATTRCRTSTTTCACRGQRRAQLPWLAQGPRVPRSTSRCSRATTAPRFWRRWAWARSSTWTTSMPTPMMDASAAASSTPVASATARLSSMSTSAPGDRLSSSAWQCHLATKGS